MYKVVEPITLTHHAYELDQYVFVVRGRIGRFIGSWRNRDLTNIPDKKTTETTFYIDIKSE